MRVCVCKSVGGMSESGVVLDTEHASIKISIKSKEGSTQRPMRERREGDTDH